VLKAGGQGHEIVARGHGRLAEIVVSPTDDRTIVPQSEAVVAADGNRLEVLAGRRRRLAVVVVAPAFHGVHAVIDLAPIEDAVAVAVLGQARGHLAEIGNAIVIAVRMDDAVAVRVGGVQVAMIRHVVAVTVGLTIVRHAIVVAVVNQAVADLALVGDAVAVAVVRGRVVHDDGEVIDVPGRAVIGLGGRVDRRVAELDLTAGAGQVRMRGRIDAARGDSAKAGRR